MNKVIKVIAKPEARGIFTLSSSGNFPSSAPVAASEPTNAKNGIPKPKDTKHEN
jgi:hypothetical protein